MLIRSGYRFETPENITIHCLAVKKDLPLKQPLDGNHIQRLSVPMFKRKLGRRGISPYYLYRQKYARRNGEISGYTVYGGQGRHLQYSHDGPKQSVSVSGRGSSISFMYRTLIV